jgi:glyoxylase-like metal-dependent hydrolase (beta-lactamase superfamily II)
LKIINYSPTISLIDVAPPIPFFEGCLGAYVITEEKTAIIDPGPASFIGNLFSALEQLKINPGEIDYILASHIHLDHTGGMGHAVRRMPNAEVVVHGRGKPHLVDPSRLWQSTLQVSGDVTLQYGQPLPVPADRIIAAPDGLQVDLGSITLEVLATPGHANHCLSFYDRNGKNLFAGDSAGLFHRELGQVRISTPPPFNMDDMLATLERLIALGPETIYYNDFGRADKAVERLMSLKKQVLLWRKIISGHTSLGWQEILDLLKKEDEALEKIETLPSEKRERELFSIKMSITGFVEYFRRKAA